MARLACWWRLDVGVSPLFPLSTSAARPPPNWRHSVSARHTGSGWDVAAGGSLGCARDGGAGSTQDCRLLQHHPANQSRQGFLFRPGQIRQEGWEMLVTLLHDGFSAHGFCSLQMRSDRRQHSSSWQKQGQGAIPFSCSKLS